MSQAVAVNDYDRFSFAVFMALLVHLLIIFGIGFSLPDRHNSATTLDVTLAQTQHHKAPDEADFLAQANQLGSGTLAERAEMTTTELADYASEDIRKTQRLQQTASAPRPNEQSYQSVTTTNGSYALQSTFLKQDLKSLNLPEGLEKSYWERNLEIASLEAKYDTQVQEFSKKPRVRRLTASSTRSSADAFYMNQWLNRIHKIGNLNYPSEAKRQKLYGELRLMVAVKQDGTVYDIEVLKSSGHKILDDAAKHIVRQASPFSPFGDELRKKQEVLEIIRTWKFESFFSTKS